MVIEFVVFLHILLYPNPRSGIISGVIWSDKYFIWPDKV